MKSHAPRYVVKRGLIWYARFRPGRNEKVKLISTGCTDKREAMVRAKALREAYQNQRWDVIRKVVPGHGLPTIDAVIEAYQAANAEHRMVRAKVEKNSIICLRTIMRETGHDPASARADALNEKTLISFEAGRLKGSAGMMPAEVDRRKRTAASTINQARSLFCQEALQKAYRGKLTLPDLSSFMKYKPDRPHKEPEFADDTLWDKTITAAAALRSNAPHLWLAWLLCYELALRKSEAVAASREWLITRAVDGRTIHYMRVRTRDEYKPKGDGSAREVPMHPDVYADLMTLGGQDYLLPGDSTTARVNVIERDLADWMRALGWKRSTFTQCAHQLRREKGCKVFTEQGAAAAQAFLGHRDISTTIRHYAKYAKPLIPMAPAVMVAPATPA